MNCEQTKIINHQYQSPTTRKGWVTYTDDEQQLIHHHLDCQVHNKQVHEDEYLEGKLIVRLVHRLNQLIPSTVKQAKSRSLQIDLFPGESELFTYLFYCITIFRTHEINIQRLCWYLIKISDWHDVMKCMRFQVESAVCGCARLQLRKGGRGRKKIQLWSGLYILLQLQPNIFSKRSISSNSQDILFDFNLITFPLDPKVNIQGRTNEIDS